MDTGTYIYYLTDKDNNILYVGKTIDPKKRHSHHVMRFGEGTKMKILEEVHWKNADTREQYYISLFKEKGAKLHNKTYFYPIRPVPDAEYIKNQKALSKYKDNRESLMREKRDLIKANEKLEEINKNLRRDNSELKKFNTHLVNETTVIMPLAGTNGKEMLPFFKKRMMNETIKLRGKNKKEIINIINLAFNDLDNIYVSYENIYNLPSIRILDTKMRRDGFI
jgi:hypothetical protein